MKKWVCTRCDYLYDPEQGDTDHEVEPGTPFDEIPDEWVCPECGAKKNKFKVFVERAMWDDAIPEYGGY
jgi:rubredoxin